MPSFCLPIERHRPDEGAAKPAVFGTVLEGRPLETDTLLYTGDHGRYKVGIWQCTPGLVAMKDWPYEEFCVLLAGRVVITPEGGSPREYVAGDALVLPQGFTGTWDIKETVRKHYAVQKRQSLLAQVKVRAKNWLRPAVGSAGLATAAKLAIAFIVVA
ncbi:cupin domain-containing protein [Azospirillum picis]|uniref:Cupin superfamily protein n=1 Tax=Azospirillum picis TaxID=488438 RepID=A0ABU0MKC2_9PROT|nr:cupin domain-containing protein [Azospirillum picis]MBP2300236.1 putative cupin superfamily protein [Azospirillum picis]MDQ0533922.1 putative cupin superfamily protein [Azospirillum picis]